MSEHILARPGLKGVITSKGNTKTDETGTIIKYKKIVGECTKQKLLCT